MRHQSISVMRYQNRIYNIIVSNITNTANASERLSSANIDLSISIVELFFSLPVNRLTIIIIRQVKKNTQPICTKNGMV